MISTLPRPIRAQHCVVCGPIRAPGVGVALYAGLHPDERLDVGVEAVGHQLELSVGRDEGDRAVVLEPGQSGDSKVFKSKHL